MVPSLVRGVDVDPGVHLHASFLPSFPKWHAALAICPIVEPRCSDISPMDRLGSNWPVKVA